jgi:hypothetical protein
MPFLSLPCQNITREIDLRYNILAEERELFFCGGGVN